MSRNNKIIIPQFMSLQSKEELSQNKKILSQKANNKFRNLFQN